MAVKYLDGPFIFRLNDNGSGPHLLIQVLISLESYSEDVSLDVSVLAIFDSINAVYRIFFIEKTKIERVAFQ